ncbi:hypothetical protein N657DRAFT_94652 [Parathielavia appendiculata]|uniref:Uncharacterized protein n=1 Tax=Parathielavia appendiculata TaxID=2587402 RepID=A0AAN6TWE7_9PEZI|nr:hypothetical protein N657DRAFT_94652 [Parathielavia appendiculata]
MTKPRQDGCSCFLVQLPVCLSFIIAHRLVACVRDLLDERRQFYTGGEVSQVVLTSGLVSSYLYCTCTIQPWFVCSFSVADGRP